MICLYLIYNRTSKVTGGTPSQNNPLKKKEFKLSSILWQGLDFIKKIRSVKLSEKENNKDIGEENKTTTNE